MTAVEVGLVVAVALLTVVVASLARALAVTTKRLDLLERRLGRKERSEGRERREQGDPRDGTERPARAAAPTGTAPATPTAEAAPPEGDAVDIRGVDPEGEPTVVPLEANDGPTLVAFLSTSCGICVGIWERLRDGALAEEVPGVLPVVVTKDEAVEDPARIRGLATSELPVVLSSEAWDDYEVPGSPYVMVVSESPGSVVTEGAPARWEDVVRMATSVAPAEGGVR